MRNATIRELTLYGDDFDNTAAGTTADITVYIRDKSDNILLATGLDVPVDTSSGYAKGCRFIDTNVAAGTGGVYENVGTATSCNFDVMGTISALSVDTAEIAAAAVTLAKLAVGVTPSHVVKYSAEITWSGGGVSLATTVTGVASTDIVIASIHTVPSEAGYLVSCAATLNTITTTLSAANTTNDAVISYMVLRAAA